MNERTYKYGVIFWNEKTGDELYTFFDSTDWFTADDYAKRFSIEGYTHIGATHFIEEREFVHYTRKLENVAKRTPKLKSEQGD